MELRRLKGRLANPTVPQATTPGHPSREAPSGQHQPPAPLAAPQKAYLPPCRAKLCLQHRESTRGTQPPSLARIVGGAAEGGVEGYSRGLNGGGAGLRPIRCFPGCALASAAWGLSYFTPWAGHEGCMLLFGEACLEGFSWSLGWFVRL